jgi:hypothetical protein
MMMMRCPKGRGQDVAASLVAALSDKTGRAFEALLGN